jgi:flavin-dependent dehydrogenase
LIIEKKQYPFHRVCGEYISNEALPFLKSNQLYPKDHNPPEIKRLLLSAISGKSKILDLDLGGFGISRYAYDFFLYEKALEAGVEFILNTSVENVEFLGQTFQVRTSTSQYEASLVIAAFGKRSNLDIKLAREFTRKRSPYVGVKYHLKTDYPHDLISLHNFPGGYCGLNQVEDDVVNLCYLVHREKVKAYGSIAAMEQNILKKNPLMKSILENSTILFDKPETINEISFERKLPVEQHMLMIGDAAGMITPLCGNGMAMAIHAAKLATKSVIEFFNKSISREQMEASYSTEWHQQFSRRLWIGRQLQKLFGSEVASLAAVNLAIYSKVLSNTLIKNTHGAPFK